MGKPENVMLDAEGYIKLIDFGISKKLNPSQDATKSPWKFRTFTKIGTPHYMAPEFTCKEGYGAAIDFWALGVVFFEMVCGHLPFGHKETDTKAIMKEVRKSAPQIPDGYTDKDGRALIANLLEKDTSRRLGGTQGSAEFVAHAYFSDRDEHTDFFSDLLHRRVVPPYIPSVDEHDDGVM